MDTDTDLNWWRIDPVRVDLDRPVISRAFELQPDGSLVRLHPRADASGRDVALALSYVLRGAVDGAVWVPSADPWVAVAINGRMHGPALLDHEGREEALARAREEMALPGLYELLETCNDSWHQAVALARRLQ